MIATTTALLMAITLTAGDGGETLRGTGVSSVKKENMAETSMPRSKYVVVFDFTCKEKAGYGSQLADSVRLRLRRHEDCKVIDRFTTAEMTPPAGVSLKTSDKDIIALLKSKFAAHIAVFGDVQKMGPSFRAEIRCVDISGDKPAAWTKAFSNHTERARGVVAMQIVEAVRGQAEWKPPEYGNETEPKSFSKPLNVNGDFQSGKTGWEMGPDNVTTFLVADPRKDRQGRVLRIFTDVERDAWLKYRRDLILGKADPENPPKIGTVANKYATVAGLEGVHYRSEWIKATPGRRYWLVADMKGRTSGMFFAKIFVKGFNDFSALADGLSESALAELGLAPDEFVALPADKQKQLIAANAKKHPERHRREVYRWYLACRNEKNDWRHYAAPFPPRGGLPKNVQWLRIDIYAYWPPGEYFFDDVHLYADPRQKEPQPEEKPRTPHFKKPSTQPGSGAYLYTGRKHRDHTIGCL
ncbi:MAG: hypothetical protein SVV80_01185 [Planctomycetota bacterium]|nr:hypothetical protein [Planctomycetota bacterium]